MADEGLLCLRQYAVKKKEKKTAAPRETGNFCVFILLLPSAAVQQQYMSYSHFFSFSH